jgi:hypothetical protein
VLQERHLPGSKDVDERVHVPPRVRGAVAGEHEARLDVVGQSRNDVTEAITVEHRSGTAGAERLHVLQLGTEALGQRHVVERHHDLGARGDVDTESREVGQQPVEIPIELTHGGATSLEALGVRRAQQPDAPARDGRHGARPDPQRTVARQEPPGDRPEHAGTGKRRHQRRTEEPGVAARRA